MIPTELDTLFLNFAISLTKIHFNVWDCLFRFACFYQLMIVDWKQRLIRRNHGQNYLDWLYELKHFLDQNQDFKMKIFCNFQRQQLYQIELYHKWIQRSIL